MKNPRQVAGAKRGHHLSWLPGAIREFAERDKTLAQLLCVTRPRDRKRVEKWAKSASVALIEAATEAAQYGEWDEIENHGPVASIALWRAVTMGSLLASDLDS